MSHQDTFSQPKVNAALSPLPATPLWAALGAYDLPAALLRRLAQEQRWTQGQAAEVAQEYLRFVYLAATCPHPVTPPRAVDAAWHLHLTFTRDYWERLTPLLPRPLHHEPGEGRPGDAERFEVQYAQTLAAYARTFGQPAPADIWPDPSRAPRPQAPRRVQGSARRSSLWLAAGAAVFAGVLFAGQAAALWIALAVFAAVLLLARAFRGQRGRRGHPSRRRHSDASDAGAMAFIGLGSDSGSWEDHRGSGGEGWTDTGSDSGSGGDGGGGGGSSCGGGGCSS